MSNQHKSAFLQRNDSQLLLQQQTEEDRRRPHVANQLIQKNLADMQAEITLGRVTSGIAGF